MDTPSLDLKSFTIIDQVDKGLIRNEITGCEFVIGALDILFLRCIDGNKSVVTIRQELAELLDYDLPMEELWKAFDRLSDIGVLNNRLCPPAGGQQTSRRKFLSKLTAFTATTSVLASNLATAQSSSEQTEKVQAEQNQKQQAEQNQKNPSSFEQNQKQQAEQDQKNPSSSEQSQKQQAEQSQKQQAEQNQKNPSSFEQDQKLQAEQDQKNSGSSEQDQKQQAEQNQKQQAEQNQKQQAEQNQKQQAEQAAKQSSQNELSNKEMQIKSESGNNPPASVSEPTAIVILGLGLGALAFRQQRINRIAKEKLRLTETGPDQNEAEEE